MPNTISDNLQRLINAKNSIATAITAKGGTVNTGDGFEEFPDDIATIPSGSSTEITGTISGSYVGTGSIAKRLGDIVIIYIYFTNSISASTVTIGTVSGLVTNEEFNNKTNILAVAGIVSAMGSSSNIHGATTTVTTSCSNDIISIKCSFTNINANTYSIDDVKCVVVFKV